MQNIAPSLILAALRGLLSLEFRYAYCRNTCLTAGRSAKESLPTGRQALEYYIPPYSGQSCYKFMNYMG